MKTITISSWVELVCFVMLCVGGLMLSEFLSGLIKGYRKQKKSPNKVIVSTEAFKEIEKIIEKDKEE